MADEDDENENKICFEEIQFFPIASQTNVYGLTTFTESNNGCNKVLVASLKGNVLSISSRPSAGPCLLISQNVPFKNLQGADIVSIDSFSSFSGLHIGVTFIKNGHTNSQKSYLNIYCGKETESDIRLESIADTCQSIELDFIPFQLTHAMIANNRLENPTVFLLSGGDQKIHMFVKDSVNQQFVEKKVDDYFPEFANLSSNVTWMDIYSDNNNERRITCFACQNGLLKLIVANENEIIKEWSTVHDGPVSSVRIFTFEANSYSISDELKDILELPKESKDDSKTANNPVYLLVTGVIEPSVIYEDILNNGLSKLSILPDSDQYDCVVCSYVSDVDWDGTNEILLGTYGQELLVYKLNKECNESCNEKLRATLGWTKSFAQPIYSINYVDLTNDGVRELIVASSKGLHVLQHKFAEITVRFQEEFSYKGEEDDSSEN